MGLIDRALVILAAIVLAAVGMLGAFVAGRMTATCPVPPDPKTIIQEHEVIRYIDRPVVKEKIREVEKIVDRPFYRDQCLDDDGLHAINSLIEGTAAGRVNPRPWPTPAAE